MSRLAKWFLFITLLGACLLIIAIVGFEVTLLVAESYLPDIVKRDRFDREIWRVTRVSAFDGTQLGEFFKERRTLIDFEELPDHLINAVVAAEDKNFFMHEGVDWKAVVRAAKTDLLRRAIVQGASTITQQLAKNLYLSRKRTLWRKVQEALLARKIEKTLSKEQILHQYLNLIYWGHGCYGVREAARFYFDKDASDLTLAESVLLAGIIKGPELYTPVRHPEKARARMEYVLGEMRDAGYLDRDLTKLPFPRIRGRREVKKTLSPYGVDAALVELFRIVPREGMETAGLVLSTYIDPSLQRGMNQGVDSQLSQLGISIEVQEEEPSPLCACINDDTVTPGCPIWARVISKTLDKSGFIVDVVGRLGVIPHDMLEPLEKIEGAVPPIRPGGYVKVMPVRSFSLSSPWLTEEITVVPVISPQVAAVLLDAESGEVRALYGGVDHKYHPYNRAISARRPVGSTIKPFVYLAAMELLDWDEKRKIDAGPLDLRGAQGERWRIRDSHEHDKRLTMEEALAISSNCAAVRTVMEIGAERFAQRWTEWGLPPLDTDDPSVALGSSSMSPVELAAAYALLANQTCAPPPAVLSEVRDSTGGKLSLPARICLSKVDPDKAGRVRQLMSAVVDRGTGREAAVDGLEIYGKTGTSSRQRDAWFAGIVGSSVLVVWVGSDDYTSVKGNSGPTTAARLWRAIAERVF